MDRDHSPCANISTTILNAVAGNPLLWYTYVFVWTVGVLGNLVNIIVFGHKRMMNSYVNVLFYWLAMCNFLELLVMAPLSLLCGGCFQLNIFYPMKNNIIVEESSPVLVFVYIYFSIIFLLMGLHTITILLNIALTFSRYVAILQPVEYKVQYSSRTARRTVMCTFILGFALCSPFLLAAPQITSNISNATAKLKVDNYSSYSLIETEDDSGTTGIYSLPGSTSTQVLSIPPYHWWITLLNGTILRVGLLIVLLIACVALMGGNAKVRRQSPRFNRGGSTHQITTLTLLIACVFSVTEIPIVVSGIFSFPHDLRVLDPNHTAAEVGSSDYCGLLFSLFLSVIVPITLLISSSYTVFCFLSMNTQYRETLKFLLSRYEWAGFSRNTFELSNIFRGINYRDDVAVVEDQTPGVLRPLANML